MLALVGSASLSAAPLRASYTTTLPKHISEYMPVTMDSNYNKEWNARLDVQRVIGTHEGLPLMMQRYKLPWPLKPRELLMSCRHDVQRAKNAMSTICRSVDSPLWPLTDEAVRMEILESEWRFEALARGGTRLSTRVDISPQFAAGVPGFIVKYMQDQSMKDSVREFARAVDRLKLPPQGAFVSWKRPSGHAATAATTTPSATAASGLGGTLLPFAASLYDWVVWALSWAVCVLIPSLLAPPVTMAMTLVTSSAVRAIARLVSISRGSTILMNPSPSATITIYQHDGTDYHRDVIYHRHGGGSTVAEKAAAAKRVLMKRALSLRRRLSSKRSPHSPTRSLPPVSVLSRSFSEAHLERIPIDAALADLLQCCTADGNRYSSGFSGAAAGGGLLGGGERKLGHRRSFSASNLQAMKASISRNGHLAARVALAAA